MDSIPPDFGARSPDRSQIQIDFRMVLEPDIFLVIYTDPERPEMMIELRQIDLTQYRQVHDVYQSMMADYTVNTQVKLTVIDEDGDGKFDSYSYCNPAIHSGFIQILSQQLLDRVLYSQPMLDRDLIYSLYYTRIIGRDAADLQLIYLLEPLIQDI